MSVDGTERKIDEKGRVTLPQSVRERLDLDAGERVRITVEDGRVVVQPHVSRTAFIESMEGIVNEETKRDDAPTITPEDLKDDWTSDLPDHH
ncbi:transcription regulator [Halovivax asiaticus JCM 14624]|uniref:Transcription regulator n=1 Tax=Halovivax asiaticus JCM 14624 TaxID=1227490 RepID=M0BI40_9EURY|nr:AbrB/MazE/SpoVT family DNA-binding domain-containing protein [Halovivax asiaticus]ELZ09324.1 transcription regulator [Halovivax asiaticus JCM 14624]